MTEISWLQTHWVRDLTDLVDVSGSSRNWKLIGGGDMSLVLAAGMGITGKGKT